MSSSVTARFPVVPLTAKTAADVGTSIETSFPQSEASDEVLLTHVAGGDQQALGCLFQRYGRLLRSIAARILGDGSEAEDLVQDLFFYSSTENL